MLTLWICVFLFVRNYTVQVLKFIEEIQKEEEIEQKKAEATTGDL